MDQRPQLWLVRHGATKWSESGRHTSVTDLPLLDKGRKAAAALAPRLAGRTFVSVLCSPRLRARQTAAAAGFPTPEIVDDLAEWAYGPGEGLTSDEVRAIVPGWRIWTHGAPRFEREGYAPGETREQVAVRMDRIVDRARSSSGNVLVFGHGHSLRALTVRWLGMPIEAGCHFPLQTGTLCVLGYEKENAAIVSWNVA